MDARHPYPGFGEYTLFEVDERTGLAVPLFTRQNEWMYTWGVVAARCIGFGDASYKLNAMYIEFENVADPEDEVLFDAALRADTLDYYSGLASSETRDYLRIQLQRSPELLVATGFEDYIPADEGNQLTLFAVTSGTEGVHGKAFSDAMNSKICGLALVATPTWADPTQDVLYARDYWPAVNQRVKEPATQIHVSYVVQFP